MKRFITLLVALLTLVCVSTVLAQSSVPFRGTVDMPTVSMGKDTVIFRPMGLGTIREGIGDLQDRMGDMEDAQRDFVASFVRHDERVSQPAPVPPQSVHPIWWMLLGGIVGLLLGLLIGRSFGDAGHGGQVTGPLVQGPLVTCPGHSAPVAQMSDGPDVPIAQIPAIRGTSYRVELSPPAETTRHTVEELRMSPETGAAIEKVVRAIGEAVCKPEQPKPADTPAPPQA